MKDYNLLELFKGTGSVGKIAKTKFNIVSLDFESKYKPDIETDILKWNYKKFYEDTGFVPDFIWASPPCNTYSPLAYPLKERDTKTAEPKSERAKMGTRILYKTLQVINFFIKLNPDLCYVIENPRGMMRYDKKMKKLPYMTTTCYCLYGDERGKPTNFWSNFPLKLKEGTPQSDCWQNGETKIRVAGDTRNIEERYFIPAPLIRSIFKQFWAPFI